ncbi:contactin-3 [Biomphalaria glabrata]
MSYICQMNRADVWKLDQLKRDFSYGTNITDPNLWETGPNITYLSPDTVFYRVDGQTTKVILDCVATGNPRPTFKWFKRRANQNVEEEVTSATNSRVTITSGRLVIINPDPFTDSSWYSCVVSNKLGTAVSRYIELSFGYIDQFSNVQQSEVQATMYMGKELTCHAPPHNTELSYNWFKSEYNFIRPEFNAQYFLSRDGNLYISEVQASDQDDYFCMVFMSVHNGQVLSGNQPPSRMSLSTKLKVVGENANTYGPDIHNKFPQVFPDVPMAGADVFLECLAYGRLPLKYSWVRDDQPLNPKSYLKDHNRVLVIPSARLEDSGSYTCVVQGYSMSNKTLHLRMKAQPVFPFPLQNQHVDAGSRLTWTCHALGVPPPVYTWYKNGVRLSVVQGSTTVFRNTLTIDPLEIGKHDGVYQCEATNDFGSARSAAQIRVLFFAPTFSKSPVPSFLLASAGGNVTIPCQPEAAPRAQVKWLKEGVEVGNILPSGALLLSALSTANSGNYTCVATNELGEARSTCFLSIQEAPVFTVLPSNVEVVQNETAVLDCQASLDERDMEAVYAWKFYSHLIDLSEGNKDKTHYWMPMSGNKLSGKLYIINAQYFHEGQYTCMVTTATGVVTASAYVTVKGAPGEPGGVHVRRNISSTVSPQQVVLLWRDGLEHGYPATKYRIEFSSIFDKQWKTLREDITIQETHSDEIPDWRAVKISEGLMPGSSYRFRVQSGNHRFGYGDVSSGPYRWYTISAAAPVAAPQNVGGGGGSVGILSITWNAMPRDQWGSSALHYCVYYRRHGNNVDNSRWIQVDNLIDTSLYITVGPDNYYLPYEVMVQAVNEKGRGPNSTVAIVYSAEDVPTNVSPVFESTNAINGTAGIVTWKPVPDTREAAKGKVFGYQINYWLEDTKCLGKNELNGMSINIYGDVSSGMLVGLDFSGDYCLNIQFQNNAGMGPKTDNYYMGMNDAPPSQYPEYVTVLSHGNDSVRLIWRGISTIFREEPLLGYKALWWDVREDIRTAKIATFSRIPTGVIHGIEKDVVYKLRVLGYSRGGDGKKSPTVYFTLGGQVLIDPLTTDVMNDSRPRKTNQFHIYFLTLVYLLSTQVAQT